MQLAKAQEMTEALMAAHGLEGWHFNYDNAIRRLGYCHHSLRRISLSKNFVKMNEWKQIQETVFHEIAHALCGANEGHNKRWKMKYVQIGGTLNRNYAEVATIPRRWVGTCPNCLVETYAHRRSRSACRSCCNLFNNGKWTEQYLFTWRERKI